MHGAVLQSKYNKHLLVEYELLRACHATRRLERVRNAECFIFAAVDGYDFDGAVHEARRVHRVSTEKLHGIVRGRLLASQLEHGR